MLLNVIKNHEQAEAEKCELAYKNQELMELVNKHEQRYEALKMQIRFKESHIAKLRASTNAVDNDEAVAQLREEIALLQKQVAHNPETARYSMESRELRAELKQVKAMYDADGHNQIIQTLRVRTLELERALRDALQRTNSNGECNEMKGRSGEERIMVDLTFLSHTPFSSSPLHTQQARPSQQQQHSRFSFSAQRRLHSRSGQAYCRAREAIGCAASRGRGNAQRTDCAARRVSPPRDGAGGRARRRLAQR